MDLKRISVAIKRHTKKRQEESSKRHGKRSHSNNSSSMYSIPNDFILEPKTLYLQFNPDLQGKERYQTELLDLGNKAFDQILPIRGTLNDEKLDYFTWRLHGLYVEQLDKEEQEQGEEPEECIQPQQQARVRMDSESSNISSSSFSSNSAHSSSSNRSSSIITSTSNNGVEDNKMLSSIAMSRIPFSSDLIPITEPGWIDMQDGRTQIILTEQQREHKQQADYSRHAIRTNEALASIPLLEREERMFQDVKEDSERGRRRRESDESSEFDQFYDLDNNIVQTKSSSNKPIITIQDLADMEEDEEDDSTQDLSILPPPLLPASMFHRANFGFRQSTTNKRQQQKRSNSSMSITKLKNLFNTSLLMVNTGQEEPRPQTAAAESTLKRPQTLLRAHSEPIAQLV